MVKSVTLTFQSDISIRIHDIITPRKFRVGAKISDHLFKEKFKKFSIYFIPDTRDMLNTTRTSQAPDGGYAQHMKVISQNNRISPVSTKTSSGHCWSREEICEQSNTTVRDLSPMRGNENSTYRTGPLSFMSEQNGRWSQNDTVSEKLAFYRYQLCGGR